MTADELKARFPHISADCLRGNLPLQARSPSPAPLVERPLGNGTLAKGKAKRPDPTRFLVRVTSFRTRLLDEDNLSEKWFCDCLRYAGIIPGDSPAEAKIEVSQVKVSRKTEERTEIEVTPLAEPLSGLCGD